MSEPEKKTCRFSAARSERSAARKRWHFFGKDEDEGDPEPSGALRRRPAGPQHAREPRPPGGCRVRGGSTSRFAGKADDDGPPSTACSETLPATAGRCRSRASGLAPSAGEPEPTARRSTACSGPRQPERADAGSPRRAARRSFPSTARKRAASSTTSRRSGAGTSTQHSTIAELAGLEEHDVGTFPSSAASSSRSSPTSLLVICCCSRCRRIRPDPRETCSRALMPQPKDDTPIPVIFQDAPGRRGRTRSDRRSPTRTGARAAATARGRRPTRRSSAVATASRVSRPGRRRRAFAGQRRSVAPGARRPKRSAQAQRSAQQTERAESEGRRSFRRHARRRRSGPARDRKLAGLDRAIREAARGAVGGEGGSPPRNPDGGFVDSGPLSFDTTWYDWGPYAAEMVRRIKLHWDVPGARAARLEGQADGPLLHPGRRHASRTRRSSAARASRPSTTRRFQAIVKSSPFRPLPADLASRSAKA